MTAAWVQELGWTLLHFLWQGTAIAAIYTALRRLLRRSLSAQARYLLSCSTLAAMTLAPPVTWFALPRGAEPLPLVAPLISWTVSPAGWQRILPVFVAIWAAGVLGFSIRLAGGWRLTGHLRRASHPAEPEWQRTLDAIAARVKTSRPVRLLISPLIEVPTVIGWLRPVILAPASALTGLPAEHIHALLAHELAHIRRHDYIASVLQNFAETILFYHPAVWWVSGQIRAERELCCDDIAVSVSGDALTYARALAQLESIQPSRPMPALAANGGSLFHRIRRLIEPAYPATDNLPGPGAAWAMTLLWLAGIGVTAIHATQTPGRLTRLARAAPPVPAAATLPARAGVARSTLLFDPLIPATRIAEVEAPRRQWNPRAIVPPTDPAQPKIILPPAADDRAFQTVAWTAPLPATPMRDLEAATEARLAAIRTPGDAAPEAPPSSVIRATTHLVQVEVVVRNGKGPVAGLRAEDFQLFDNGQPRAIRAFTPPVLTEPVAPSATVLFIDRTGVTAVSEMVARQRLAKTLRSLPASQPVAICVLDSRFRVISEATDSPERRAEALANLLPVRPRPSASDSSAKLRVLEAIAAHLADLPGRKNLIWIGNAFEDPPEAANPLFLEHIARVLRALNTANVALFPIAMEGVAAPETYVSTPQRNALLISKPALAWRTGFDLRTWAEQTDGAAYFNTGLGHALRQIFEDTGAAYTLGFYPESLDGRYHQLKVKVARRGVEVRSRQGYLATNTSGAPAQPDAAMRLPHFYTGGGHASVHLALDVVPSGMLFRQDGAGWHGEIAITAIAKTPEGREAARFTDLVPIDLKNQREADAFVRAPWRYEHAMTVGMGTYVFEVRIAVAPDAVAHKEMRLNIEPWNPAAFGISGIAFGTAAHPARPASADGASLVAAGRQFVPAASSRFRKSDRVYFYTEVYEPGLKAVKGPALRLEYRVLDRGTGEVKADTGMAGVAGYIHPGSPVVPFATVLPLAKLKPGSYRLEVLAEHSSGPDVVARTAYFEVD